jgi:hypothetical protein
MTDDDIKHLRDLAQAATTGPWKVEGNGRDEWYVYAHEARYAASWCGDSPVKVAWVPWEPSGDRHVRDSDYIAAASPDVVLALLDRLAAAERERRQPAPSAKPVAWRTVVDDATHSVSVTKTAAEMRASLFREENRGRDFLVRVVPLYDAPQPAPSAEAVAWMTVEEDGTRHGLRYWREGTHREVPLYMAPQPTLPPEAAQAMRAVSDWLTSERIRDWRYMEGTAFWEDAAKHVAALRAALGGEAGDD